MLNSTCPLMLTNLYENYENKKIIKFFPAELVSPWSKNEGQKRLSLDRKLINTPAQVVFSRSKHSAWEIRLIWAIRIMLCL